MARTCAVSAVSKVTTVTRAFEGTCGIGAQGVGVTVVCGLPIHNLALIEVSKKIKHTA